ncbi:MAG: helix-turn-helix domain-containing protein [Caulobacteraceae bacterium]|nr:helix-turn-helix domain-containing protein [Caulobacteraceae bacterium]
MPHLTHVRRARRRWALSQPELAHLLNCSSSLLSRLERGECTPDVLMAFRLQAVFGLAPRALFPGLYRSVEDAVMAQAADLDRRLGARQDYAALTKRRLLTAMTHRASGDLPRA